MLMLITDFQVQHLEYLRLIPVFLMFDNPTSSSLPTYALAEARDFRSLGLDPESPCSLTRANIITSLVCPEMLRSAASTVRLSLLNSLQRVQTVKPSAT